MIQVPTINQDTGIPSPTEPTETLQKYRSGEVLLPSHKNKRQVIVARILSAAFTTPKCSWNRFMIAKIMIFPIYVGVLWAKCSMQWISVSKQRRKDHQGWRSSLCHAVIPFIQWSASLSDWTATPLLRVHDTIPLAVPVYISMDHGEAKKFRYSVESIHRIWNLFLLLWLRRFERHDSLDFSELKNLRLFGFWKIDKKNLCWKHRYSLVPCKSATLVFEKISQRMQF